MKTLTQYQEQRARILKYSISKQALINEFIEKLQEVDAQMDDVSHCTASKSEPYGVLSNTGLDYGIACSIKALRNSADDAAFAIKHLSEDRVIE